jgi:hypothetical protein
MPRRYQRTRVAGIWSQEAGTSAPVNGERPIQRINPMIKKIISGGQTGADQAALDAAIKWNIPHGGWIPKGRLTEAGKLPDRYMMQEMPTDSYSARTEQNVIDSDGTVIISHGPLTDGSKHAREMAIKYIKPWLHLDLNEKDVSKSARTVSDWVIKNNIGILNVAGPRASNDPSIYQAVMHLMTMFLIMDLIDITMSISQKPLPFKTISLERAVTSITARMSLRERCYVANMLEKDLFYLEFTLGAYIRKTFGLDSGHEALADACRKTMGKDKINDDEIARVIIMELWKKLRETHLLRVVK